MFGITADKNISNACKSALGSCLLNQQSRLCNQRDFLGKLLPGCLNQMFVFCVSLLTGFPLPRTCREVLGWATHKNSRLGFAAWMGLGHAEKQLGLLRSLLINRVWCLCFCLLKFDFLDAWEVFLAFPFCRVTPPGCLGCPLKAAAFSDLALLKFGFSAWS